jgi:N-methylhydantoinase A/oxoprolinase/acetone carboxylase beta subunit
MTGYRLGIDVGGTNTDAVILTEDGEPVVATKTNTSEDVTEGILTAFDEVLSKSRVGVDDVEQVMLGTTHCTNAVAERKGLTEVGVLRIGAPATTSVPPMVEWPEELVDAISSDTVAILGGGHEYDGRRITDLDETEVRTTVREFGDVEAFAVTSVFSPVQPDHERRVKSIIREVVDGEVNVSLSHEIGSLGLIERENATILNAALTKVAERTADSFLSAMQQRNVDATLYFAKNDGTLMNILEATRHPLFMIASGPANSVRGAAHLSGVKNGIVIDVGGTTTDVGVIRDGFPRESTTATEIGGVNANFHLPDIVSLAIGGGSVVDDGNRDRGRPSPIVGPESVGRELEERSRVFGGDVLTATDIEAAAGTVSIGHETLDVSPTVISDVRDYIRKQITAAVTKLRTGPDPVPAVVVGGGSFLIPDDIDGITDIYRPDYYDTANAVGVATAQVSGRSDRLYDLDDQPRDEAFALARQRAIDDAVKNGVARETVTVLSIDEIPLTYLSGDIVRIKVDVAGDLRRDHRKPQEPTK